MIDEYLKAKKAGEKEYKAKQAAGEYPYLPALDDILEDADTMQNRQLGLMEIPVELITGTKTRGRQNSFAPDFMPLLDGDTEFAAKWSNLYEIQMEEGFSDPVKVYEYLHRFYVLEGNKRVSVSKFLDMPVIMADVTRIMPSEETLKENPVYEEFLKFYAVAPVYDLEPGWPGAYTEAAELLGMDLETPWPEDMVKSLRRVYWMFSEAYKELGSKVPALSPGDAFMVYLRIYIKDALGYMPSGMMSKRILRIKKELLTESNRDRVALVETADDALKAGSIITRTGSAVSKVLPHLSYSHKHPLKAAFIYSKKISDSGWASDHERGRLRLENAYGGTVVTRAYEDCPAGEAFEAAVDDAASWGADIVFTTAQQHMNDTLRAAIKYKDIKFLNCSINLAHQAVRTYYAKLYEAKFLAGIAAGAAAAMDGTHMIGYCSDLPIYGTIASINAFAIGAAMADPGVKIHLDWSARKDADWWWDMVDRGIHVISAVDSMHNKDGSSAYGVCYVERCEPGMGNDLSGTCLIKNLAVPYLKWGKVYEIIVRTVLEGNYYAGPVDKKDQATNYWWGMISGAVDIEVSEELPVYTRQLIKILKEDIITGRFNPFDGELRSRDGLVKREHDAPLKSLDIIQMDWLNENVEGEIPKIDALNDEARATVKMSGIASAKQH